MLQQKLQRISMVMLTPVHKHVQKDRGQVLNNVMVWRSREVFRDRIFNSFLESQSAFGYIKHNIRNTDNYIFLGNPIPEAKWVLRGRIVTNNTSPLHGSGNQQYVIQEEGEKSSSSFLSFLSASSSLPSSLHVAIFMITTFVIHIPRWVPEMVQPYLGQYLCG